MGNAESNGVDAGGNEEDQMGYRVLGVQAGSPAASAGLVSFFDFIVGANGRQLRVSFGFICLKRLLGGCVS